MSVTELPTAFLYVILSQLAALLLQGAGGNRDEAWEAAKTLVMGHSPQTVTELRLIVRSLTLSLQAGEALAQAVQPDMPLNRVIRLRSGAVALTREATKAERGLEKLHTARAQGQPEPVQPEPEPVAPSIERVGALIEENITVAAYAKAHGISFTEALQRRQRDKRIADRERKKVQQALADAQAAVPA
ncbi:MAG TPA: hypothetical protein VHB27_00540 [Rhodopila sp.]|uniref:hypothetical protein n=1 Tax=Rhodopila sp. TaxID=2480087 RepID=UPI002CF6C8B4|nr:hypothetical protein [Rhodopila sp.]HVY13682.1 hypothetical protein [Rhodopila sp.]